MELSEAKLLIANPAINNRLPQKWAELGSGNGLFSKALLSFLHPESEVIAVDKQPFYFSEKRISFLSLDFEKDALHLPLLNGILMVNSLHFIKDKIRLLEKLTKYLLPDGSFILVEYDTETANRWVPYPLSFSAAKKLFAGIGFNQIEKINERQSVYNSSKMYAARIYKG